MPDSLDLNTVIQVAKLARIELPDEEARASQQQLAKVLDYVSHLDELELAENIEPFFGAVESFNAVRLDVAAASAPRETILENAPDTDGQFYRVPPVFK